MLYNFDVQNFLSKEDYYNTCLEEIENHLYPTGDDIKFDYEASVLGSYEVSRIIAFLKQYELNIIFYFDADLSLLGSDSLLLSLKPDGDGENLYILLVDQKLKISENCPDFEKVKSRTTIIGHEIAHYIATQFEENDTLAIPVTGWNYIFGDDPLTLVEVNKPDEEKIDLWYLSIMFGPRNHFLEEVKNATKNDTFCVEEEICKALNDLMTKYTIIPSEFVFYLYVVHFIEPNYHFLVCDIDGAFKYSHYHIPADYPEQDRRMLEDCYQMMNNPETAIGRVVANYFEPNDKRTVCFGSKLYSQFMCFAQYHAFTYIKGLPHFVFCIGTIQ